MRERVQTSRNFSPRTAVIPRHGDVRLTHTFCDVNFISRAVTVSAVLFFLLSVVLCGRRKRHTYRRIRSIIDIPGYAFDKLCVVGGEPASGTTHTHAHKTGGVFSRGAMTVDYVGPSRNHHPDKTSVFIKSWQNQGEKYLKTARRGTISIFN